MPYEKKLEPTHYITPNWSAPNNIKAFSTTRKAGGHPATQYDFFNLATHVGDETARVLKNRMTLCQELTLPQMPCWLNQTHGNIALSITPHSGENQPADAAFTRSPQVVCAVLTADCLPILICNTKGTEVAAIHGGWRSLYGGIIENTLTHFTSPPKELMAWLGPAISATHYEVGDELREKFIANSADFANAFSPHHKRWHLDLTKIAHCILRKANITQIFESNFCTYSQPELFYSHRLEGPSTGRIATLVWISPE